MLLLTLIVFSVVLVSFNKKTLILDEVELTNYIENTSNMFAIMVEDDSGSYVEYTGESFPTDMLFNSDMSNCINNNGETLTDAVTFSDGTATVYVGETMFCYLYFDLRNPGIIVTTYVNGTESYVPTTGSYTVTTINGSYWSDKYRTLNITSVSSETNSKYTLTFATDTSTKTYLRDYIVSLLGTSDSVTSGNGYLVDEKVYIGDYTNATTLEQTDYGTTSQFYSTSASSTSGTSKSVWVYADGMWTSEASSKSTGKYYHLSTTVDTSGHYQMCYSITSGSASNRLYVYVGGVKKYMYIDDKYITFVSASSSKTNTGCVDLGYIASGTNVKFAQYASTATVSMSVYLQLGSEKIVDAGIRYEGANPDNYVWFNNEMWRIVGVMSTVTDSGTENLVKIIKDDSIGAYSYDGEENEVTWGDNTLYTLLNDYYWGASDGTGTDYCIGAYEAIALPNCDFETKGIDPSSYYGNMVEYVYWNTGATSDGFSPATMYVSEIATQAVGGYVGIMYASDYGYAYYSIDHSTDPYEYYNLAVNLDWLFKSQRTWTMTDYNIFSYPIYVDHDGYISFGSPNMGFSVSPVMYLKSNVYIVDGTGSESDPYILGIE